MPRRLLPRASRRQFAQAALAMGLPWGLGRAGAASTAAIEAFAGATSVKPGATLEFYARHPGASNRGTAVPLTVTRLGWPDVQVHSTKVTLTNKSVPSTASSDGCRVWGVAYKLNVPASWPSGLYWATFGSGSQACTVPFVVRPVRRTAGVNLLVQVPVTTAQAYNPYGGKSLYDYNSSGGAKGVRVSFNRPFSDPQNFSFDPWQPPFIRWLAKNGIAADFCTSMDLQEDATLLTNGHRLFSTAGHDEYWSRTMRDRLDAFVALGGNVAIFSGNTCWWQVRFDDTGGTNRRMICFKSRTADTGGTALTKTTYWADLATPYPETSSIGLSYLKGASWTNAYPRPPKPWVLKAASHWAFAGTGLAEGAAFGAAYVGYEVDGADFRTGADGRFYPTAKDGAPATLRILAQADCSTWDAEAKALGLGGEWSGHGAMAIFSRGGSQGTVFNAGSTDWAYGLQPELDGQTPHPISTITRNVLRQLSAAWSEPAEVRQWQAALAGLPAGGYDTLGAEAPSGMALQGAGYRALALAGNGTVPVYRYQGTAVGSSGTRYALSTEPSVPADWGWANTGTAFHAWATAQAGTVPLYRYVASDAAGLLLTRHGTSASPPAGWSLDSAVCHVLPL